MPAEPAMALPPPIKRLMPTLVIEGGYAPESKITCSLKDFRTLLQVALASVTVDEKWYLQQYPDVAAGVTGGTSVSAAEHYRNCGYLEGRLPCEPVVDEPWYLSTNGDVMTSVREGRYKNGKEHFIKAGYAGGRQAQPASGFAFSERPGRPPGGFR
jgi:hypothetical protein